MKVLHKDFVGIYEGVFPDGYCQHMIEEFEALDKAGAGHSRQQSERNVSPLKKKDTAVYLSFRGHQSRSFDNRDVLDTFFQGLQICYEYYVDQYPALTDSKIRATAAKMQRTDPMGGYHLWHNEQSSSMESSNRALVYMLYLNTLNPEQAGETEFLYQQQRISPKENTLIIWPASFTHTHRGNAVYGNESKYVITGWFNYDF